MREENGIRLKSKNDKHVSESDLRDARGCISDLFGDELDRRNFFDSLSPPDRRLTYVVGALLPEIQVDCALFLDVALSQCSIVVQRLAVQNQDLLVRRDAFLVLNLTLHAGHRMVRVDLQRERSAGFWFHEDLNFVVAQLLVRSGHGLWMLVAHRLRQGERAGVL